jgi:hypothetical protein
VGNVFELRLFGEVTGLVLIATASLLTASP